MSQEDILVSSIQVKLNTNHIYLGKGCSLIADDGDVWILNQSESSIFVQVIQFFFQNPPKFLLEPNLQFISSLAPGHSCKNSKRLFHQNFR